MKGRRSKRNKKKKFRWKVFEQRDLALLKTRSGSGPHKRRGEKRKGNKAQQRLELEEEL